MSTDLDDQLAAYGSWLRQATGAGLTPAARLSDESDRNTQVNLEPDRRSSFGNAWLRVAAGLLVVVGIGALVVAQRDSDSPPAAAQYGASIDPAAHLFVLPTDPQDLELSDGGVYTARPDEVEPMRSETARILVGREVDGGFSDLIDISVANAAPEAFGLDGSTEVETPTGPAIVSGDGLPFQRLMQQRADVWLLLNGATGTQDLIDLLSQVSIDSSGSLTIRGGPRVIVDEFNRNVIVADYSTSYDVTDPSSGASFYVETATSPSAIILGAYTSNPIMETTVNGTPAWIMTRDGDPPEGLETALVWRATPNRVIAISASAPLAEVRAMAERLQQVTDEDWFAALPGAFVEE